MKIVVLDGYTLNPGDITWEGMEALGELTVYDRTKAEDVAARIGDADVVYTNKTPITKETLDACPNVKFPSLPSACFWNYAITSASIPMR